MTHDLDSLTETFARHETLAPDTAEVLAKSHVIARSMKRRRRVVQVTGSAVLGAGVVAAGVTLPGAIHHSSHDDAVLQPASGGHAGTGLAGGPTTGAASQIQDIAAFRRAGYGYLDAMMLAHVWRQPDLEKVKVRAGRLLVAGKKLPLSKPVMTRQKQANAHGSDGNGPTVTPVMTQDIDAFDAAGYTYNDATQLARIWKTSTFHAKVEGGQKVLDHESLPVSPSGTPETADQKALSTYFADGYDYADAQQLAQTWHMSDITQVKIKAGTRLENGETLPVSR